MKYSAFPHKKSTVAEVELLCYFINTKILVFIQQAFLPTNSCNYFQPNFRLKSLAMFKFNNWLLLSKSTYCMSYLTFHLISLNTYNPTGKIE